MFKLFEVCECKSGWKNDYETFHKASDISNPVKEAVYITIDSVKCQIELPANHELHAILYLIWATHCILASKDLHLILGQGTELKIVVLQV